MKHPYQTSSVRPSWQDLEVAMWSHAVILIQVMKLHTIGNIPCRIPISCVPEFLRRQALRSQWNVPIHIPWPHGPWPLTYDLDLRAWPRYPSTWLLCQNSSLYVYLFGWDSKMDKQTDTRCQNFYTHHARDVGCKNTDQDDMTG